MKTKNPITVLIGWIALALAPGHAASGAAGSSAVSGAAASANAGVIEGRVLNPATGEYLGNAEVRIQGTEARSITLTDGRYRLPNVPVGSSVTLVVTYTGYSPSTHTFTMPEGVYTRDFSLTSNLAASADSKVVELEKFTVSTSREGNAKAIMEQRNALTVKNVVATETFGSLLQGNVGDVLQYVAGMQIIYSGDVPSTISMNGMPNDYGAMMVDGVRTSGATRGPALSSYSAYATDTIEINKTNAADMDADAPSGSINMRSKSAFQRKGRFLSLESYVIHNPYNPLTFGKMDGPNDGQSRPLTPSFVMDFSDVYLNGKLGVVLNLSHTFAINGTGFLNYTYNDVPTAVNPTPLVLTNLNYGSGGNIVTRRGGGLNIEYKVTPNLTLAMRGQASWEDNKNHNTQFALTSTRNSLAPGSGPNMMIVNPTTTNTNRLAQSGNLTHRIRNTHSFAPQLLYNNEKLAIDASIAYTRLADYFTNRRLDGSTDEVVQANMQLFNVGWVASRQDPGDLDFTFRQTAGPDLYVLNNWRSSSLTNNVIRNPTEPITKRLLAQFNAKFTTGWSRPTFFKAGVKTESSEFYQWSGSYSWTFVGPTGNRFDVDIPVTVAKFDPHTGGNLFTDRKLQFPDRRAIGALMRTNPGYFVQNPADPTNATNVAPIRAAKEYVDAAYFMGNTQWGPLSLQGGIRWESTESQGKSYERGILKTRKGKYDDFFFSGAARYRFTETFRAIASFSQSIKRVNLNSLSAVLSVNDTTRTGTLPNPELKPEHGNNYSIRFEKYFEPVGTFALGTYIFDITDLQRSVPGIPAEDIGLGDDYPGYTFTALSNVGRFRNQAFEMSYSQQLTFLPGVLRGIGVFANYNMFKWNDKELAYRSAPRTASGGITFRYRRLNAAVRAAWQAEALETATTYTPSYVFLGTSINYALTDRLTLTLTGRNITNQARYLYLRNYRGHINGFEVQGASWGIAAKVVF